MKPSLPLALLLTLSACGGNSSPTTPTPTPHDPLFDRAYYTQLVHNGGTEPRRVQTSAPRFVLRTMDDTGVQVEAASMALAEAALTSEVVPAMTGGRYHASVRRDDGGLLPGEIAVNWVTTLPATTCGRSAVGGHLLMLHHVPQCGCAPGVRTNARLVKHEVGHVLGFWHTDGDDLMADAPTGNACDAVPTAREQHHAAISYEGGR